MGDKANESQVIFSLSKDLACTVATRDEDKGCYPSLARILEFEMEASPALVARGALLDSLSKAYESLLPGGQLVIYLDLPCPEENEGEETQSVQISLASSLVRRFGFEAVLGGEHTARQGKVLAMEPGTCPVKLVCRRSPKPRRWRLTDLKADGYKDFADLFLVVFGHPIGQALWRWKYADGRGCAIAAWRGSHLIAHYGGNLRQVLAFGQPVSALQVCDAMVAPGERGIMTKTGAMFQVTAAFLELYQGLAGIPLAFGFPNRRAMRLGERLGLYAEVGSLCELRWPSLSTRPRLSSRLSFIQGNEESERYTLGNLWKAMARDLSDGVVGVRDWPFLQHRYLRHPERHYCLVLVRRRVTGTALGLLVLHREEEAVALTDLVAPLKNIPMLLVHARRLTRLWGLSFLYCWITRQHVTRFATQDTKLRDIDVSIPTNVWVHQPFVPEQLRDCWWLTMGDTDFL